MVASALLTRRWIVAATVLPLAVIGLAAPSSVGAQEAEFVRRFERGFHRGGG